MVKLVLMIASLAIIFAIGQVDSLDCIDGALDELKVCAAKFHKMEKSFSGLEKNDAEQCCPYKMLMTCSQKVFAEQCTTGTHGLEMDIADSLVTPEMASFCRVVAPQIDDGWATCTESLALTVLYWFLAILFIFVLVVLVAIATHADMACT
ncbi:hypothetical protein HDE_10538 [Halotydeus destructor]|nr:hypothetical protein HDE_10538 [Halotydeus destructor]